ncbi:MOSC domain protein [Aspergillus clavatus NRRL 1]|uniref:MOSC domain protein n=1 Tax=Aspergillus clavatus (strain ATCC 1007 / CBS 513.65 / DSM 816 / NCTC 3887 / NRRL 1 / QM 1276 / 107) TaxID=344612 RepID=A1CDS3_ASPCL|nr:MOSC domain protein [Aspergillus clavatus NRRL 1]EAW12000.1 MOSC domain protein [Aspergillus clavatus NRRL 1]
MRYENILGFFYSQQDAVKTSPATAAILLLSFLPILVFIVFQRRSAHSARPRGCRKLGLPSNRSNLQDEFDPKYSQGLASDHDNANGDKQAPCRIKALFTYPIKSCAGVELDVADVVATGFAFDRQFCFAEYFTPSDEKAQPYWDARTLRNGHYSRLALLRPELWVPDPTAPDYAPHLPEVQSQGVLVLFYPRPQPRGRSPSAVLAARLTSLAVALRLIPAELSCRLPLVPPPDTPDASYPAVPVRIWKDTPTAFDYGAHLPPSLREFLAPPDVAATTAAADATTTTTTRPLTLFRVDARHHRRIFRNAPPARQLGFQPVTGFADAYPLHILNLASVRDVGARCAGAIPRLSVRRFRANIVVEGPGAFEEDHWRRISIKGKGKGDEDGDGEGGRGVEVHTVCRTLRCRLPNVDPDTGVRHASEPDRTLKSYRRIDPGDPTNACLGMQCVPAVQGMGWVANGVLLVEFTVRVGDRISVLEIGEHFYLKSLAPGEKVEGV